MDFQNASTKAQPSHSGGMASSTTPLRPLSPCSRLASWLLLAALGLLTPASLLIADAPRDLTDGFVVPEGLQVTQWAESPQFSNPTSIDIDRHGRIWVAEAVNYRTFHKTGPDQPPGGQLPRPQGDRIVILEDTDGDGVCDQSKVFVQDKDLHAPLGVAVLGPHIYVSCSPHLIRYTDRDRDDKPEEKEIFLTGFGGRDHDHGLHSVMAGPGGRLVFNVGNAGPHRVTDNDGWTLRSGSTYTGGTPHNTNNVPALVSDDGRIWTGGLALRVRPDGTGLSVLAHNFRNSYEVAIDSFGALWQADNDDQVRSCRTSWVMEGGNMGYFSSEGRRMWQADRRPGQSTQAAHWHQDDPGVIPAGDIYGAGAPAGLTVYEGKLLGEAFRGMVLNADAGRNTVFGHLPKPQGAGYQFKRSIFLSSRQDSTKDYVWHQTSEDERTYFRPSDVAVGPDGAVYVADWYDPIVGGHAMHDTRNYGRILRVAPKDGSPQVPDFDLATVEGQITALKSPTYNVRYLGFKRLSAHPEKAFPHLKALAEQGSLRERARALWLMAQMGPRGSDFLKESLKASSPRIRVTAFRALRQSGRHILRAARKLVDDASPTVRRAVAIAARDLPDNQAIPLLLELADGYHGNDRFYLEAWGIGCDDRAETLYPKLIDRFDGDVPTQWSDRLADFVWRIHPIGSIEALKPRALATSLSSEARSQAVDALAFIFHPDAAKAMESVTHNANDPIASKAKWWLDFRAENRWRDYDVVDAGKGSAPRDPLSAQAREWRAQLLSDETSDDEKIQFARNLASSKEGGWVLIELARQNKLSDSVRREVGPALFQNPDLSVRALASQYFPRDGNPEADNYPSVQALLKREGDAARGRKLFFGAKAACAQCHQLRNEGRQIGPDLTHIDQKLTRRGLFDALLNPSAEIAFGYQPSTITLKNGEAYTGFILGSGHTVVLKDPSGKRRTFPSKEIASRTSQSQSLMPSAAALGLTPQELADLVAFLKER